MKITLFKTYSDQDDINAVSSVISRGTFWAIGPEVETFERKLAEYLGVKYVLSFNSGTSALHTLLLAHNVKDKEIIVPSFTFIATANAVHLAGGKPVFAEVENETFGLDIDDVSKRINSDTIGIMPIHYGGFPARDTIKLRKLAEEKGLLFIEDAAQSIGAKIGSQKVGTFGDSSIFSFCQNKILATGEGGAIVTNSELLYNKAKFLRSHGRVELEQDYFSSTKDNDYVEAGYNFRMSSMTAALGLSQYNKIEKIISLRREKGRYLTSHLSKLSKIICPKELDGHFQVYQMYTIQLASEEVRNALQLHLAENGIMSKIYFNPVHLKTLYKKEFGYKIGDLVETERLSSKVLNIPLYPHISYEELDYMVDNILDFFKKEYGEI